MTDPNGGWYSSLDADSEGKEGEFYVWSASELREHLGADAPAVMSYFDATPEGNFEGKNILHRRRRRARSPAADRPVEAAVVRRSRKAAVARA